MFTLNEVIPWGRSFDEYRRMFALTDDDLRSTILGCADGPASFNAEATRRGMNVVSCDPLYRLDARQIQNRIDAIYDQVLDQTRRNADEFVWDTIESVEQLGRVRTQAMRLFLEDYEIGRAERRYIDAELPVLPFPDASLDLALCSNLLFLYTTRLDEAFHLAATREMCRVASEVRIFPLLAFGNRPSPYVDSVVNALRDVGYRASVEVVPYEFQKGGNQMLRLSAGESTRPTVRPRVRFTS
jgi:hypothetical protein